MTNIPYILEILSQPKHLNIALEAFDANSLAPLAQSLRNQQYDRILMTGMGASLYAAYPAWLTLANAGLPALWVDGAELIHHAPGLVTSKTLLWIFSQSGKSAEIISLLDFERTGRPAVLLATVNDLDSPLAKAADFQIPMRAEVEKTVSTRTYINALAMGQLGALVLAGQDVEAGRTALLQTASAMESYLTNWEDRTKQLALRLGFPGRLALLGRGASMVSVFTGSLLLGEAAKFLATPFQAAEFRHGPLELAAPDLSAILFAGASNTRPLNLRLLQDLRHYQARAFMVDFLQTEWQIEIPEVPEFGLPLMEILPIQLLSIYFAQQIGIEPGAFFRTGKITLSE